MGTAEQLDVAICEPLGGAACQTTYQHAELLKLSLTTSELGWT